MHPYREPPEHPRLLPSERVVVALAALALAATLVVLAWLCSSWLRPREPECWAGDPRGMRWMVPCDPP